MTNFEWLLKDKERLKELLVHGIAVNDCTGKLETCRSISCDRCLFSNDFEDIGNDDCYHYREKWLDMEHESLYKRGDIILTGSGNLVFVLFEKEPGTIIVSNNIADVNNGSGVAMSTEYIKQKVGNILDNCDRKEI